MKSSSPSIPPSPPASGGISQLGGVPIRPSGHSSSGAIGGVIGGIIPGVIPRVIGEGHGVTDSVGHGPGEGEGEGCLDFPSFNVRFPGHPPSGCRIVI